MMLQACLNGARAADTPGLPLTPDAVLQTDAEALRCCGLSARKVEYMGDLARHFVEGRIQPGRWAAMSDAEIIAELTAVRGIGLWTAEMRDAPRGGRGRLASPACSSRAIDSGGKRAARGASTK